MLAITNVNMTLLFSFGEHGIIFSGMVYYSCEHRKSGRKRKRRQQWIHIYFT